MKHLHNVGGLLTSFICFLMLGIWRFVSDYARDIDTARQEMHAIGLQPFFRDTRPENINYSRSWHTLLLVFNSVFMGIVPCYKGHTLMSFYYPLVDWVNVGLNATFVGPPMEPAL
jgi:hypothetical protein